MKYLLCCSYHNSYDDDIDDNAVTTQTKRNNTNDKASNEDHDISEESENGQINTKRKRTTNQLEDCVINNSSLQCIKTVKSKKTITENSNGENGSDVRKQSKKEFRYNMRRTNLTKDDETLEKSKKSDTAMNKNCIQNGADNIISEDMEDNDGPRIRKTLIVSMDYLKKCILYTDVQILMLTILISKPIRVTSSVKSDFLCSFKRLN